MTGADQVTVRSQDSTQDGVDERGAELAAARLADARVPLAIRSAARITMLVAEVVLTIAGCGCAAMSRAGSQP